jgi:NAD(P)H-dependent flavin oxidoreductase YrpB (nitropropane dioxygenase family)
MFKTKITQMLGIRYPIVGETMMWITVPEFTAAISNAGGLGVLASANSQSRGEFATALNRTFGLTDNPFAVNLDLFPMLCPIDDNEYLDVLNEKGLKIMETSAHSAP